MNSANDEIYTGERLSEDELDKIQKDFSNAIRSVNISLIEDFINKYQKKYDIINRPDKEKDGGKYTALFLAVNQKDKEACYNITKLLLNNNANVNQKDAWNQTPMFYIAKDGKTDIMKMFLQRGANINEIDGFNQTPLFYACRDGQLDTVKYMYENGVDIHHLDQHSESCLFYAARDGRADIVKFLIEKGINVNQVDTQKSTALSFAKKKGHLNIVEMLSEAGAVNTRNNRVQKKEATVTNPSFHGGAVADQAESRMATSQSASVLQKRKKDKEKTRNPCRIVFTDRSGNSRELTTEEWEQFKRDYPVVAGYIENPDSIPKDKLEEDNTLEGWESVASQILNNLWKFKGAQIFHKPVDPIRLGIPDYPKVIKQPMDFSTIKKKLTQNVYENIEEWIADVELVFTNCKTYNGVNTEIGQIGVNCQNEFARLCGVYAIRDRFVGNSANGHVGKGDSAN